MASDKKQLQLNQILIPVAIVLLVIVVARYGYSNWSSKQDYYEQALAMQEMQLDKYRRIVANSGNYESMNRALTGLRDEVRQQRLFSAGTEALAQARFQNLVKKLARENRVDIRTTKIVTTPGRQAFPTVSLRIDAKAEIGDIAAFLLDLRSDDHYIFVPDLVVRIINNREQRYYYFTAELRAIQDIEQS